MYSPPWELGGGVGWRTDRGMRTFRGQARQNTGGGNGAFAWQTPGHCDADLSGGH